MSERGEQRGLGGPCALVALAALVVYLGAFGQSFVYDDVPLIPNNPRIQSLSEIPTCFRTSHWNDANTGLYRPLVLVSFALNHAVHGLATPGYTAVNLLLHAGVSVLVLLLAVSLGAPRRAALAAGLIFAVHPVHTEAVAWIVRRDELLSAGFGLLALLAHRRSGRSQRPWPWRVLSAAAFAAALLSKESAVALLGVALAMDWLAPAGARPWRARLWDVAGWVLAFALVMALRASVLGDAAWGPRYVVPLDNPLVAPVTSRLGNSYGATPGVRVLSAISLLADHLRLLAWPAHLSADYSFDQLPLVTAPGGRFLIGLGVLVAAPAGVFALRERAPLAAFGLAFLALTDVLASNLIVRTGTILAERMLYLPSVGFVLVLALAWHRLCGPKAGKRWLPALGLGLIVLGLAGARTAARVPVWRDAASLWRATVADAPRSARAHSKLGAVLFAEGDARRVAEDRAGALERYRQAATSYARSLEIYPDRSEIALSSARAHLRAGQLVPASGYYLLARELRAPIPDAELKGALRLALDRLPAGDPRRAALENALQGRAQ